MLLLLMVGNLHYCIQLYLLWCNLIFNLKAKLNHGPKEQHKVVFKPLVVFFLFHGTLDLPKVQLICLEQENNLLTSLTITKTTTWKCPLNRIRIILFSFTNPQLNLVIHIKDNTKDFKLHAVHHFLSTCNAWWLNFKLSMVFVPWCMIAFYQNKNSIS